MLISLIQRKGSIYGNDPGPGDPTGGKGPPQIGDPGAPSRQQHGGNAPSWYGRDQAGGQMSSLPTWIHSLATPALRAAGFGAPRGDELIRAARQGNLLIGPQGFQFADVLKLHPGALWIQAFNPNANRPGGHPGLAQGAAATAALQALMQQASTRRTSRMGFGR